MTKADSKESALFFQNYAYLAQKRVIMKRAKLLTSVLIIGALVGCSSKYDDSALIRRGEDLSYYYASQKIFLEERQDLMFVSFCGDQSKESFVAKINSGTSPLRLFDPSGKGEQLADSSSDMFLLQGSPIEINKQIEVFKNDPSVLSVSKILVYEGSFIAVSNEFSVKLKKGISVSELENMATEYGCKIFQRELVDDDIFFLEVDKSSELSVLQLACIFYESGLFVFTSPDFYFLNAFGNV